jgi:Putative Actinobacterial Holin-X, holin superfamily III
MALRDNRPAAGGPPPDGPPAADNRSLGELLRDLANDTTRLIRDEIALARTEILDKVRQAGTGAAMIGAGAVLAIPALVLVLAGIAVLLAKVMPPWVACLVVGIVTLAIAGLLAWMGLRNLSATSLAPERTAASLRRDAHLVQEKVS